jgi:hypothetical protein
MKIALLPLLVLLTINAGTVHLREQAPQANRAPSQPNLAKIGHISPKGRVQDRDYNSLPIVDELLAQGTKSIPYLIRKLDDETEVQGVVIDYWSEVTVADIALLILTDFFTDSTWQKTTIPGISWDDFLERGERKSLTAEKLLRSYIVQHGRKNILEKWTTIWSRYQHSIMWDASERCFRVRPSVSVSCPSTSESPIVFTATVAGVDANTRIEYVWRLNAGRIVTGQGTTTIVVDASIAESRGLTATVEILGFPSGFGNTASCSLSSH